MKFGRQSLCCRCKIKDLSMALPRRKVILYSIPGENILTQRVESDSKKVGQNYRTQIICFPPFWDCYPQKAEWRIRNVV